MEWQSLTSATLALVALGGNLPSSAGRPEATLRAALVELAATPGLGMVAVSRFWHSPAHPAGSGPDYVNAACALTVEGLDPPGLLDLLHGIETRFGRERGPRRWQARPLDLDLIAMGERVLPDAATQDRWRDLPPEDQPRAAPATLVLPHPRLEDRAFVLAPLCDIAPGWRHPRTGRTLAEALAALPRALREAVRPLSP